MANTAGIYIKTSSGLTPAATVPGPAGTQGATGTQGPTGATGSVWYTGNGAPATGTGVVNDFYLDITAGDVYKKTATSTWTLQGNIKGNPGDLSSATSWSAATGSWTVTSIPQTRTMTLSGNLTIAIGTGFSATQSGTATIICKQPATGGPFTVTWPSTLEWPNDAAAPAMPTAANSELVVHLFWTGQAWRAVVGGIFYP